MRMHQCQKISLLGKLVELSLCVHMDMHNIICVPWNDPVCKISVCRHLLVQWSTEPVHAVLLSVGNYNKNCHHLVQIHKQDCGMLLVSFVFKGWSAPTTSAMGFFFMAIVAAETANISSSSFSPSSSSNNLEDTSAILVWIYTRNRCQNYICIPKSKSSMHTFNRDLCGHMETLVALTLVPVTSPLGLADVLWRPPPPKSCGGLSESSTAIMS